MYILFMELKNFLCSLSATLPRTAFVLYRKPHEQRISALTQMAMNDHSRLSKKTFIFNPFQSSVHKALEISGKYHIFKTYTAKDFKQIYFPFQALKPCTYKDKQKADYAKLFEKAMQAIQNKTFEKVVLAQVFVEHTPKGQAHIFETFGNMLETYPSAFVYVLYHPTAGLWLGASPEPLLELLPDKRIKTTALAGTQLNSGAEPLWTDKENQEHESVVSYIAHILQKSGVQHIAKSQRYNSAYNKLWHLRTDFEGKLLSGYADLLHSLHPTPAVCGFPTETSRDFILQEEGFDRSYYTGFLGEQTKTQAHFFVNLRCMQFFSDAVCFYAGGGVNAQSQLENEWQELQNKMQSVRGCV